MAADPTTARIDPPEKMDITEQRRTYHAFLILARYVVLANIVAGAFLILALTGGGWLRAAIAALACLIVGLYFAKDRREVTAASSVGALVATTAAESGHTDQAGAAAEIFGGAAETAEPESPQRPQSASLSG
jgi:hypothetical protein